MSRTKADVEVRIFGNIKDFSEKMNRAKWEAMSFHQKLLATSGIMKSWGRSMTMGITLPVVVGMALSVKAASALEEEMNKVKVVFGATADQVVKFSEGGASALGMAQQEALAAAGAFGNLFNTTGLGAKASADMSTKLVQLAADMASFNNISTAEALEKLRSGLVGEAEPLRTVGVLLSEARVAQEAYASGIAAAGAKLTEAQKVQARYNLILKDTKVQQGDFERTSGSLANQLRVLRADVIDLGAKMGEVLIPMVKPVVKGLASMATLLGKMPGPLRYVAVGFGLFAAALGPTLWAVGSATQGISALVKGYRWLRPATIAAAKATKVMTLAQVRENLMVSKGTGRLKAQIIQLGLSGDHGGR